MLIRACTLNRSNMVLSIGNCYLPLLAPRGKCSLVSGVNPAWQPEKDIKYYINIITFICFNSTNKSTTNISN